MYMSDKQIADEVSAIRDEDKWPYWPVLPMKKIGGQKYGILIAGTSTVVLMNLFELKAGLLDDQIRNKPKEEFSTIEEMVAAGWIGD